MNEAFYPFCGTSINHLSLKLTLAHLAKEYFFNIVIHVQHFCYAGSIFYLLMFIVSITQAQHLLLKQGEQNVCNWKNGVLTARLAVAGGACGAHPQWLGGLAPVSVTVAALAAHD